MQTFFSISCARDRKKLSARPFSGFVDFGCCYFIVGALVWSTAVINHTATKAGRIIVVLLQPSTSSLFKRNIKWFCFRKSLDSKGLLITANLNALAGYGRLV